MFHAHLDVLATRIPPSQITDHTRNPTGTTPMEHSRNPMETVIELFRTRDIANLGMTLTKDTADRDTLWDKCMDDLLTHTNRQIEPSTAYSRYPHTKASSSISSSNQHTRTSINQHTRTSIVNQLYCSTLSSQPESCTSTCTHSSLTDRLRIIASRKNTPKNCTTTSRHSMSIAKVSSKMKSIRKTTAHTMSPMTINKSSMMMTLMLTMLKSVLQHAINATAALPSKTPYTGTFKKHGWCQNQQKQKTQSHTG